MKRRLSLYVHMVAVVVCIGVSGGVASASPGRALPRAGGTQASNDPEGFCLEGSLEELYHAHFCYSATLKYTRSYAVPTDDSCDRTGSTFETDTVNESWQVSFSGVPADPEESVPNQPEPPIFAPSPIVGSYHDSMTCPPGSTPSGSQSDLELSQPGTFEVGLVQRPGNAVQIEADTLEKDGGLSGTLTLTEASGAVATRAVSGFPEFGQASRLTVPASGTAGQPYASDMRVGNNAYPFYPIGGASGTLTVTMSAIPWPDPVARCDAYWVRPGRRLTISSPGVLANDKGNNNGTNGPKLISTRFSAAARKFSLLSNGYLTYRAGPRAGKAIATYRDYAQNGSQSNETTVTIHVSKKRPRLSCSSIDRS